MGQRRGVHHLGGSGKVRVWRALTLAASIALLLAAVSLALPGGRSPYAPTIAHAAARDSGSGRPQESVAYARVAVVRVLTYYAGAVSNDTTPIPWPNPCVADGALVGTTGPGLNSFQYVLLPTAAVNPLTPCAGVQAGFAQLNGRAASWSITRISVLLDAAYTGTALAQIGSLAFTIDPAQISTNGGPSAPPLLALALTPTPGAPAHDLLLLTTPQPQDPPANPAAAAILDLTRHDGQPLRADTLTGADAQGALYPIALPVSAVGASLQAQLGLGAPEIDTNGRIVAMLAEDSQGNRIMVGLPQITAAIGQISGKSGPLATLWASALSAYYASPPQFGSAASDFGKLAAAYPDFAGVLPFQSAAAGHSTAIPPLSGAPQVGQPARGSAPLSSLAIAAIVGLVLILLLLLALRAAAVARSRRPRRLPAEEVPAAPSDEALLDLLPADLPLSALDDEDAITQVVPVVSAAGLENGHGRLADEVARRSRAGLPLMPYASGLTDVGIRRAARPNQDSILAVHGIRYAQGRVQTYGLFIVADGMGGHVQGLEASQTAIQIVAASVLQPLTGGRLLDEAELTALLEQSMRQADVELRRRNAESGGNMGTTFTAALILDDIAVVANVGDSRTYLLSPETGLRCVTTDHSVVASLVAAGIIKPEDIYTHPRRNQIYRSLGGQHDDNGMDTFVVPLQAGDKLLLCSDGLWEMVRDPQIASILRGTADPQHAAELLVREANTNGGDDNIAAIVVRLLEDLPEPIHTGARVLAASAEVDLPRRADV